MRTPINRRTFLRAAGVTLGLPLLEAMAPPGLRAAAAAAREPRRLVAVNIGLGFHAPHFLPRQTGSGYQPSRYLEIIDEFRDDYTVISGASHPDVDGGHFAEKSFLTAAPHPGASTFQNSVSIDQLAAEKISAETPIASLALTAVGGNAVSYSRAGVAVPTESKPSRAFARMFLEGTPEEIERQVFKLRQGRSVLDAVLEQTKRMRRDLNARDREKLDQYFTAVRTAEERLVKAEEWARVPKPKVDVPPPEDVENMADVIGRMRLMYDMIALAFETDSTRLATFTNSGVASYLVPPIDGVSMGYHNVSHHGKDPKKIDQLTMIETRQMQALGEFLRRLKSSGEEDSNLLERTTVLFGSNLGNASSHDTRNMPIIVAGGGFKHGQHLAFDRRNNYPLPNLFVSILQRLGLEVDSFASSTGTMKGLEVA